jgi:hypothetical protein
MLDAGVSDEAHKRIIENMLADAEEMLKGISG